MRKTVLGAILLAASLIVPGGAVALQTMTTSTTHHTTTAIDPEAHQDRVERRYRATVRGIVVHPGRSDIVYEKTVESGLSLSEAQTAIEEARQAVLAGGALQVSSALQTLSEVEDPTQATVIEESERSQEVNVSTQLTIGPGTILVGEDQQDTVFIANGTTNLNTNTHTETFVLLREVTTTTLTKTASFDVVGSF